MDTTMQQAEPSAVAQEHSIEQDQPPVPAPSHKTPQDFYAEITKRPDVRELLAELANT